MHLQGSHELGQIKGVEAENAFDNESIFSHADNHTSYVVTEGEYLRKLSSAAFLHFAFIIACYVTYDDSSMKIIHNYLIRRFTTLSSHVLGYIRLFTVEEYFFHQFLCRSFFFCSPSNAISKAIFRKSALRHPKPDGSR